MKVSLGSALVLLCATQAAARPFERVPVIVTLAPRVDVTAFRHPDKHVRRARIVQALQAQAGATRGLQAWLAKNGATDIKPLWIIKGVAATVTPAIARTLTRFGSVTLDATIRAPRALVATPSPPAWNLAAVHAPGVWNLGFDGSGVVVANMDTGVDLGHPDLRWKWRGGWWDPFRNSTTPYDAIGHGTETMGIVLGDSNIGVAPGAQWIAAKIYDDSGNTTVSVIHQAFEWLLTAAPDVVNASFGMDAVNACDDTFQADFEALRAAGILVVFAAGNSGPNAWTSISPANNANGFSVGAVDETNTIGSFSSRGASSCTNGIFPDVVAPGVDVLTTNPSLGGVAQYTYVSGTSFSAPHVAGVAALLASAFPNATVAELEGALRGTAMDLGAAGPDDDYGQGLVDALAAYATINAQTPLGIVTTRLPDAFEGVVYTQALRASGGVAPYRWSLASGSLPTGLQLDATGVIEGAAAIGRSNFTVQVTDAAGTAVSRSFAIGVGRVPSWAMPRLRGRDR